jgi:hypothetical protein
MALLTAASPNRMRDQMQAMSIRLDADRVELVQSEATQPGTPPSLLRTYICAR